MKIKSGNLKSQTFSHCISLLTEPTPPLSTPLFYSLPCDTIYAQVAIDPIIEE